MRNFNGQTFDLVVIGSGPGGQRAAVQAAKLKKKVLVIEQDQIGGACLHHATIPSKTLREAALNGKWTAEEAIQKVMEKKLAVVETETQIIRNQLERNGVQEIIGTGSFKSSHEVAIRTNDGEQVVRANFIVIAVGTHPYRPSDMHFDNATIYDSDTILDITRLPRSMAILGAGVIGSEYASIFARLGVKVTLVDRRHQLFRAVDEEVVSALERHFVENGIETKLGTEISKINSIIHMGKKGVECILGNEKRNFDAILYCMGRTGNVSSLKLENAKLTCDERGIMKVNQNYQTNIPHIYAVGDIIGPPALAASSSEQGRLASVHAFGLEDSRFPETFPFGIYTIPEISSVGMQETDLKEKGIPYVVGRAYYRELARGMILNDSSGFLKLLVDKQNHRLLGVHILGSGATELIHIGQILMATKASVEFLVNNVFNYPTLAEAYKVAAYNAFNQLREV